MKGSRRALSCLYRLERLFRTRKPVHSRLLMWVAILCYFAGSLTRNPDNYQAKVLYLCM